MGKTDVESRNARRGRIFAVVVDDDARLEDRADRGSRRAVHALGHDARLCHQRTAHRADRRNSHQRAARCAGAARHLRPCGDSADLVLHRRHGLAGVRDPLDNHDDDHHRRLVVETPERFAQLTFGGGADYFAARSTTTFSGQLSTFVLRRAESCVVCARARQNSPPLASARPDAARAIASALETLARLADRLGHREFRDIARRVAGLNSTHCVLFSFVHAGQSAGEFDRRAFERFCAGSESREPRHRRMVSRLRGTFQSRRVVFHAADDPRQRMGGAVARRLFSNHRAVGVDFCFVLRAAHRAARGLAEKAARPFVGDCRLGDCRGGLVHSLAARAQRDAAHGSSTRRRQRDLLRRARQRK